MRWRLRGHCLRRPLRRWKMLGSSIYRECHFWCPQLRVPCNTLLICFIIIGEMEAQMKRNRDHRVDICFDNAYIYFISIWSGVEVFYGEHHYYPDIWRGVTKEINDIISSPQHFWDSSTTKSWMSLNSFIFSTISCTYIRSRSGRVVSNPSQKNIRNGKMRRFGQKTHKTWYHNRVKIKKTYYYARSFSSFSSRISAICKLA